MGSQEITGNAYAGGDPDIWDRIKYLITNPEHFFSLVSKEQGISKSFFTYVISYLFMIISSLLFVYLNMDISNLSFYDSLDLFLTVPFFILGIIVVFIYSGIAHLMVMLFKGAGRYKDTYNVCAYSIVPSIFLGAVPLAGGIGLLYSFVLMVVGISKVHNLDKSKSFIACFVPAIPLIILFLAVVYFVFVFLS